MVQPFHPKHRVKGPVAGPTPAVGSRPKTPARPARRAAPAHAPTGKSLDEAKRLHDATGDEFFGAQLFTADTQRELPLVMAGDDLHASLGANKWALADPHGAFTLSGNRGGFAVSQKPEIGVEQLALSGFKNVGAAGAGASYAIENDAEHTVRLGFDAFGAQNFAGIAPSMSWSDGTGARAGVGVGLFGATDFSIRLIETYDDPSAPAAGQALVEVRREANPGIALDPSRALHAVGMGAKFCFSGGHTTVYRTRMDQKALGEVLHRTHVNSQGLRGLIARFGAATGATAAPVPMPDLHDPLNMSGNGKPLEPGEQITDTAGGSKTVGAAPGIWGLRVGLFYHRNEATSCSVERIDATRVRVTVSPRQVDAVSMGVDALLVADARHEMSQSRASSYSAVFDLHQPTAWEAYRALVAAPHSFDADTLTGLVGVQVIGTETTESRMHRDGAGIPRPPLPGHMKIAGMGRHGVGLEQDQVLKFGSTTYTTRRVVRDTQMHRAWGGEANTRIDTQMYTREGSGDEGPEFMAVSLNLAFEYNRLTGADAAWLRDALQTLSGEVIPEAAAHARGQDYKVLVNRILSRYDFLHLAGRDAAAVDAAAQRFGADVGTVGDLIALIRQHQGDMQALSTALCDKLAGIDVPEWTALCHLAPETTRAAVGVRSDTFTQVAIRVREFLLQNAVTPDTSSNNARSLRTVSRLRREVARALSQAENDALLEHYDPAAREAHIATLLTVKTALEEAADARRVRPASKR